MKNHGFTLIEVMLVVVLMAILSAMVVVRLGGIRQRTELKDVSEEIVFFDHLARQESIRSNRPGMLVFDLSRQEIQSVDAQNQEQRGKTFSLGSYQIDEILVGSERTTTGQVTLPCSALGITPSYAVAIHSPANPANQRLWIYMTGVSGQSRTFANGDALQQLLEATSNAKP